VAHRAVHRPLAPVSEFDAMTTPCPLVAASVRRNISFPAPRPFHLIACKRGQDITDQSSIRAVEYGSSGQSTTISGFQLSVIRGKHPPPKPLSHQIPIDGQALTACPRVPSSEAFGRRPLIPDRSARAGPASETLPESRRRRSTVKRLLRSASGGPSGACGGSTSTIPVAWCSALSLRPHVRNSGQVRPPRTSLQRA
jgi:hypothetical protein